ncbi:DNA cross-link repair protein PSO2/SNM1 [Saitoella coloradoensis]
MSTFNGVVKEFPEIRVDYFRPQPDLPPVQAYLLSHVHADHTNGLQSQFFGGAFVYCTAATKEILLRLQTKKDRIHYAEGLIEQRRCTFQHLQYKQKDLIRVLPMDTPTLIEVGDNKHIRVTPLDANHCPGACMFLIESVLPSPPRAVLYTGDIRSDSSHISYLAYHPVLTPYLAPTVAGQKPLRILDKVYLDTTFAIAGDARVQSFPSKAESCTLLVAELAKYPPDTVFWMSSWTLGYEELWVAASSVLQTKIHVDRYRYELFSSLAAPGVYRWGPYLAISVCTKQGEAQGARIHVCERWGECESRDRAEREGKLVVVRLVISKGEKGEGMVEPGAERVWTFQKSEFTGGTVAETEEVKGLNKMLGVVGRRREEVLAAAKKGKNELGEMIEKDSAKFLAAVRQTPIDPVALTASLNTSRNPQAVIHDLISHLPSPHAPALQIPSVVVPFSRHASLTELQALITLFHPRDIYPCVVADERLSYVNMEACFGHLVTRTEGEKASQGRWLFEFDEQRERRGFGGEEVRRAVEEVLEEKWAAKAEGLDVEEEEDNVDFEGNDSQNEKEAEGAVVEAVTEVLVRKVEKVQSIQTKRLRKDRSRDVPIVAKKVKHSTSSLSEPSLPKLEVEIDGSIGGGEVLGTQQPTTSQSREVESSPPSAWRRRTPLPRRTVVKKVVDVDETPKARAITVVSTLPVSVRTNVDITKAASIETIGTASGKGRPGPRELPWVKTASGNEQVMVDEHEAEPVTSQTDRCDASPVMQIRRAPPPSLPPAARKPGAMSTTDVIDLTSASAQSRTPPRLEKTDTPKLHHCRSFTVLRESTRPETPFIKPEGSDTEDDEDIPDQDTVAQIGLELSQRSASTLADDDDPADPGAVEEYRVAYSEGKQKELGCLTLNLG